MLIFWLIVCGMIFIALFFVLRPLLVRKRNRQDNRTEPMLAVYRSRLAEMKTEVEAGLLSETEAAVAEDELNKDLLNEVEESKNQAVQPTTPESRNWWAAGITVVLLPVIAMSIYTVLGNPDMVSGSPQPHAISQDSSAMHPSSVEEMVDQLATRLANDPDDTQGWLMLTNSYMTLGRYQKAVEAVEHLYALHGDEPYIMLRYADVLATANGGRLSGKPAELIQKALALDPDNITGLWLAGMTEDEQGNQAAAIEYWQRLLPLLKDDQDSLERVQQLISRAQGKPVDSQQITGTTDKPEVMADKSKSIIVDISLSPDFANETDPEDSLFIYAKAVDGPPMPLAVVREKVKNLPLQVTLDDSSAMLPGVKLSDFKQIKISARISKSGDPISQPGDLIGETVSKTNPVTILINKKIP